jgi:hypothetical protein
MGKEDDESLLAALIAGNESAFQELVRRYRNQITNYLYRMLNDYDRAVDLARKPLSEYPLTMNRISRPAAFRLTSIALITIWRLLR